MPGFDFICPMNYPNRCDLPQTEVDYLQKNDGKKVGFLMYQFRNQDPYLVETITNYFNSRNCHIFEAAREPGSGVKICKICRYATASHFGIGVLTPEKLNVNIEIGLVWGQGKPVLFLANEKNLKDGKTLNDLAFDVSPYLVINYSTQKELVEGLEREAPLFLEKVRVVGLFQQELVNNVRKKLLVLRENGTDFIEFLRFLLLQCQDDYIMHGFIENYFKEFGPQGSIKDDIDKYIPKLIQLGIISLQRASAKSHYQYTLNKTFLPILRQEAFKEI